MQNLFSLFRKAKQPLATCFDYENTRDIACYSPKYIGASRSKFQGQWIQSYKAEICKNTFMWHRDYIAMVENSGNTFKREMYKNPKYLILSSDVYLHQNGFVGLDDKNRLFRIEINGTISYRTSPKPL